MAYKPTFTSRLGAPLTVSGKKSAFLNRFPNASKKCPPDQFQCRKLLQIARLLDGWETPGSSKRLPIE